MILQCIECCKYFDDEFRSCNCPHDTFAANDGQNNFKHYTESWLSEQPPIARTAEYREWLKKANDTFK